MNSVLPTVGAEEIGRLYRDLGVTEHPLLKLPTAEQVAALLADGRQEELIEQLKKRRWRISLAEDDPLQWGFEAPTWRDADRLLEGYWLTPAGERLEVECDLLGIFGGNRAQKSWYAVKRGLQTADIYPGSRLAIMAEGERPSITTPSTGMRAPGLTATRSPTCSSLIRTRTS